METLAPPKIINASIESKRLMIWYASGIKHEFKPVGASPAHRASMVEKAVKAIRAKGY